MCVCVQALHTVCKSTERERDLNPYAADDPDAICIVCACDTNGVPFCRGNPRTVNKISKQIGWS